MTLKEYLAAFSESEKRNLHRISIAIGVSYSTLHAHVHGKSELSVDTAKRLEKYDDRMSASEILGLAPPRPARKRAAAGAR